MTELGTIYSVTRVCNSCGSEWAAYALTAGIGGILIHKGAMCCHIPLSIARALTNIYHKSYADLSKPFDELGWIDVEKCPKCGTYAQHPYRIDTARVANPSIIYLGIDDFVAGSNEIRLTVNGRKKLVEHAPPGQASPS